jgi:hypothetical protein
MIEGALIALNFLIDGIEEALKAYRLVVDEVKKQLKAFFAQAVGAINAAQREVDKLENEAKNIRLKIAKEDKICNEPCYLKWGWCCKGCKKIAFVRVCIKGFPVLKWVNRGCMDRLFRRIQACLTVMVLWIAWAVVMAARQIALAALEVLKAHLIAAMMLILLILKIPEAILIAALTALKFAAKAVSLLIAPLSSIDAFKPCVGCRSLNTACIWRNFDDIKLLRIYEIAVSMEFSIKTVNFAGIFNIVVLGKHFDIVINFSP